GRVLVNDAGRRQLRLFDASLAKSSVVLDSTDGASNSYGSRAGQIVPYLGDSTLVLRGFGEPILLLDGTGHIARALALPDEDDGVTPFPVPFPPPQAADGKGRVYARGSTRVHGEN